MRPSRTTRGNPPSRHGSRALFESLEGRSLFSFSWTAQEVYLLELVNRARYDPLAEGARLGVDLTQGLTAAELFRLAPTEPLAFSVPLTQAARAHAQDMANRAFFAHINPDGLDPTQRALAAGYDGQAGENIAAGYADIDISHKAWLESLTHRKNVLSLHDDFDSSFHYSEFGPGVFFPSVTAPYSSYYTEEFGIEGTPRTYVLGVVYDDTDSNGFYSVGEGRANVRVDVFSAEGGAPVKTYTTDAAGNYQLSLVGGHYTVTFTDLNTSATRSVPVVVQGQNVKVDAVGPSLVPVTYSFNTAMPSAVANGSTQPGDLLTIATLDRAGRFITFTQGPGNTWYMTDVSSATGASLPTGQVSTWTRPGDDNTYAAAPSAAGLILYTRDSGGSWSYRNITAETIGSTNITGATTAYLDPANLAHIAGLDASGHLVLYVELPDASWIYTNLTTDHILAQAQTMPTLTGPLISYVTSWGGQNIAGLDSAGNIQSVWWAPGMDLWRTDNLSAITGAPAITGGLTCYLTGWGGINLAGIDASGNVSVTWWVPSFGGNWETSNLSQLYSGPSLSSVSINSYTTSWGGLNITGLDSNGKIVVYWWAPGMDVWQVSPLTDLIGGATSPGGAIRGVTSPEGTINLLGIRADGHLLRYHWTIGGQWEVDDLTLMV